MMGAMWHVPAVGWVLFGALLAIFWAIVVPALRTRRQAADATSRQREDYQRDLADMRALAERLQARVETLERLLDASQPEWRKK